MLDRVWMTSLTLAVTLLGTSSRADAVADDLAKFQGTWKLISVETDGKPVEDVASRNITVTFDGDTHTVRLGDKVIEKNVKIVIDPTKTPKQVTDTVTEGTNKGLTIQGIYKLDGDKLTSCITYKSERPTDFSAPAESNRILREFERVVDDPGKKDLELFEGTWRFESLQAAGEVRSFDDIRDSRLTIKGEAFTLKQAAGDVTGTFKLDATKTPKTIDATYTDGPQKGTTMQGIYEIDETTFKVCVAVDGLTRPTEFKSEAGSVHVLQVLKKEKP